MEFSPTTQSGLPLTLDDFNIDHSTPQSCVSPNSTYRSCVSPVTNKAPTAQANGNGKSQATTEQLHPQPNGGVTGIRTQWQALPEDKNNKPHAPFEPKRLATFKQMFPPPPSESEKPKPESPDPTNIRGQTQGISSAGIDLDLQSKTAWWGLLDATKGLAATKARLAESARFSQMSLVEVAYASAAIGDLEGAVVAAQGELVLRQQIIRRLEERIKRLVVELEERDTALADAAANVNIFKRTLAELQAREGNGDAGDEKASAPAGESKDGTTRHVKWAVEENDMIVNTMIKLIQDLEYRYSLLRESLESTHTMFREALSLAVPAFAAHLADKAEEASEAAPQAAVDAAEDNLVL
ncbi:hypothetical protein F5144DRAFT_640027 [Chaetomium tenue]|uniref:Uncharacterized protein n=1 Tax=Chaetomium tenue TaxID=1854479 RepID=A0ACB7PJW4_9PEZI|nr:hypothetical protein F5144DRAFT_640027 [Chaetomium globosum]